MVNIKINDVPISVEEGTTILEACREAKMIVPTLCYLKISTKSVPAVSALWK